MTKKNFDDHMLNTLQNEFNNIEIPSELDDIVKNAIKKGIVKDKIIPLNDVKERKISMKKRTRNIAASVAIIAIGFTGAANFSPTFAKSMGDVPVIKDLIKVVSFRQFDFQSDNYMASVDTPVIEGLENSKLQETLNTKYLEENKKLFTQFETEVADMEKFKDGGHLGVDAGFEVKTNNDQILSVGRYVVNTVASSSTTITYDTIDKKNEIAITLPSLFKDDQYIGVISENIKLQMRDKMVKDPNQVYWIEGDPEAIDGFNQIKPDQAFYITNEGKLMISFDKYEVGPGSMGIQEFEIPTQVLQTILVSNIYLK
ncbi:MAG: DUF3298 domain-containing protein [Cellulosilyticaceae bacterium]